MNYHQIHALKKQETQNNLMVTKPKKPSVNEDTYTLKDPQGNKHTTHSLHEFFTERFGDGFIAFCINLRRHGEYRGWTLLEEIFDEDKEVERFWKMRDPKGKVHTVNNLLKFFKGHFKDKKKAYNAANGIRVNRKYKGWVLIKCHLDDEKAPKKKVEKFWELRDPDGKVHTVKSLLKLFREHFGDEKKARKAMNGIHNNRTYNRWRVTKCWRDDEI